MTKAEAMHGFWSSFGLPAYEENCVPGAARMPYITYSYAEASGGDEAAVSGDLWYSDRSWIEICEKTDEIAARLNDTGVMMTCSGGFIYLRAASPFAVNASGERKTGVIRRSLRLYAMYLTAR